LNPWAYGWHVKKALAVALAFVLVPSAAAATTPAKLKGLTTWSTAGSRVAFVAASAAGRHGYLWTQPFGVAAPRLLRSSPPIGEEEVDALAAGPNGTLAALERSVGNTGSSYRVDVVSSRGGGATVSSSSRPILLAGDGAFLGYLAVTATGVDLYRISGAHGTRVATLAGISTPQEVAVANGHIAVRETSGSVGVFTTGGAKLATIPAKAASVALTTNRVVVRTRDKRLVVYGLRGGLVHNWHLAAQSWTAGLAAYGAYAVYLGANKAVHAVKLVNGSDRIVARAGTGFFFGGVALQKSGALVPLTVAQATTFRFVPTASL
jgi:hypothetical protein